MSQVGVDTQQEDLTACLIESSRYSNALYDSSDSVFYSLDMVRIKLKIKPNQIDKVIQILDCSVLTDNIETYRAHKLGGYRLLWVFKFEESSVSVGLFWIDGKGKTHENVGFIEYNPNKVGKEGNAIVEQLRNHCSSFEVIRYDLAIDYPVARETVRLIKDKRKYSCELSDAFTEYLGRKNKAGRVKVYDKQAEAGLKEPKTRVELTCDGEWSVEEVIKHLPKVFSYENADFSNLQRTTKAFAISVQAHLANGDVLEPWLNLLDSRTRAKLRRVFGNQQALSYKAGYIEQIAQQAQSICDGEWSVA